MTRRERNEGTDGEGSPPTGIDGIFDGSAASSADTPDITPPRNQPADQIQGDDEQGETARKQAELQAEINRLTVQMIDRKTNQPKSDFLPHSANEADQELIDRALSARRGGFSDTAAFAAADRVVERHQIQERQAEANREAFEAAKQNYPLVDQELAILPPDVYRARMQARVLAEAAALGSSTTVPGGRYLVNGVLVDCNGNRVQG